VTCGICHAKKKQYAEFLSPLEFDHAQHLSVMQEDKNCGNCHHEYIGGKLVYVKGKETYCSSCHKDMDEDNARSLRKVYHADCLGCHKKKSTQNAEKNGPVTCYGCHGKKAKPPSKKQEAHFVRKFESKPGKLFLWNPAAKMPAVPYDHKVHADEVDDCRKCHQYHSRAVVHMNPGFLETSQACVNCHKAADVKGDAGNLNLDRVYHDEKTEGSCIGCHIKIDKGPKVKEQCYECHKGEADLAKLTDLKGILPTDIPGEMLIDRLALKFPPVEFPHTYHAKLIGNCKICHHHQDEHIEKDEYKGCYVCHTSSFDFEHLNRPRGVGPIGCDECHTEPETKK